MFKRIYWRFRIILLATRWIPQINLGDEIWYKNKKYIVCNGNRPGMWQLRGLDNDSDGWVKSESCQKVWTWSNIKHSFHVGMDFYTTAWFGIWCRIGVKDWMRKCNIWPWPNRRH